MVKLMCTELFILSSCLRSNYSHCTVPNNTNGPTINTSIIYRNCVYKQYFCQYNFVDSYKYDYYGTFESRI